MLEQRPGLGLGHWHGGGGGLGGPCRGLLLIRHHHFQHFQHRREPVIVAVAVAVDVAGLVARVIAFHRVVVAVVVAVAPTRMIVGMAVVFSPTISGIHQIVLHRVPFIRAALTCG